MYLKDEESEWLLLYVKKDKQLKKSREIDILLNYNVNR